MQASSRLYATLARLHIEDAHIEGTHSARVNLEGPVSRSKLHAAVQRLQNCWERAPYHARFHGESPLVFVNAAQLELNTASPTP
jgi:hypothetical protein